MSLPNINTGTWADFTESRVFNDVFLDKILPGYVNGCRWFGGKNTPIRHFNTESIIPLKDGNKLYYLLILEIVFETAYSENYQLVIGLTDQSDLPANGQIAKITTDKNEWTLVDAVYIDHFREFLFQQMQMESSIVHGAGQVKFEKGNILESQSLDRLESRVLNAEQSNTTIVYNDEFYLKIYRKLFRDANPDYELTYFLSEQTSFGNSPRYAGSLTWYQSAIQVTLGLMQNKIHNDGNAWTHFLKVVLEFFQATEAQKIRADQLKGVEMHSPCPPSQLNQNLVALMGTKTVSSVQKLALRTAQMHLALFKEKFTRRFVPKAFNTDYKAWLLNRLIYSVDNRYNLLENTLSKLDGRALVYAHEFLEKKNLIKDKILNFHSSQLNSMRIRIHGDYHLGQVIMSGDDFFILDFEGEPEATIRDRKVKQPPMKDVAGMLRSFQYAIYAVIFDENNGLKYDQDELFKIGEVYYSALVGIFLDEYVRFASDHGLDIGYKQEIEFLLKYHLLEKAIYEMGYELNSRPDWVVIPLKGILDIVREYENEK